MDIAVLLKLLGTDEWNAEKAYKKEKVYNVIQMQMLSSQRIKAGGVG